MADTQSTFESSFDFTKPMGFPPPAEMDDHVDPSNLISSYQPSDIEWLSKDPFDILPWDLSGIDQSFNPFGEGNEFLELGPGGASYATSNHGSPAGYRGYTVKTEDAMSDASPISDFESETWSPIQSNDNKSGCQSPVEVIGSSKRVRRHDSASSSSSLSSDAARSTTAEDINISIARNNNTNPRKTSSDSSFSPSPSSSSSPLASPKMKPSSSSRTSSTNTKSTRSIQPTNDPDAAAVMKRKKAAHNAIEKRYRTNMNAKFLALGNAIPRTGLQATSSKGLRKHSLGHSRESMSSSSVAVGRRQQHDPQQQQNKSEILTNALAYITELQDENSRLKSELLVLKENLLPKGNIMWRR